MDGKVVHVAGVANQITTQWVKHMPDWLLRQMGGLMAKANKG